MMKKCPSGKSPYRNPRDLRITARNLARALNRSHEYVRDMYAYRCPDCHQFHLTSWNTYEGQENALIFTAPPRSLQEWAMREPE